jgi:hypothetical protein
MHGRFSPRNSRRDHLGDMCRLVEILYEGVDWICLVQDRDSCGLLGFRKNKEFPE